MTLIPWLAAGTERIRFLPDVANLPLRPAPMLAKQAATLDVLTGGRFDLGVGAGANRRAGEGMGGPGREPGEAVAATIEAIEVLRLFWSGQRAVRHEGRFYRLDGAHPGPRPTGRIPIILGAHGERMLRVVGRLGDGWLPSSPYVPPAELPARNAIIDEAAVSVGRDPAEIRRMYNVSGVVTAGRSEGFLRGPVDQWVDELAALRASHRIETFILWPEGDVVDQVRRFAEVAERLRSLPA